MRCNFRFSQRTSDRLGDIAVAAMIAVAVIASYGCGSEEAKGRTVVAEAETLRYTYEPASRTEAVPVVEVATVPMVDPGPEPILITYDLAESAYRDGRFREAIELFEGYIETTPDNPWGHYMLGLSARMAGDVDKSVRAFERSIDLDSNHLKSHINLARVLLSDGQVDRAGEHVDRALEIDAESGDTYRLLGRVSAEVGDVEGAMDAFERALTLDERDAWSMNNLGLLLIRQGEFERAVYPLARAVEVRDDVAIFHNNLGMTLERLGYFVEARVAYGRAVETDPTHERARSNFDRIEGRVNAPDLEPLSLETFALEFATEIETWRSGLADVPPFEPIAEVDVADHTPPATADSSVRTVKPDTTRSH